MSIIIADAEDGTRELVYGKSAFTTVEIFGRSKSAIKLAKLD
jgi:hypothetical protein